MVFYFSGTGNSQKAAFQIADILNDEVISLNKCIREKQAGEYQSDKPYVFVTPTYAWKMPRVVEQWIYQAQLQSGRETYFVLTCAQSCGNAAAYAEKLCKEKKLRFCGLAQVEMPENYVAMFPTPGEAECKRILERSEPNIAALAEKIKAGEAFPPLAVSGKGRIQSGPVNALFYAFAVHDKGFTASDACVSCGKCAGRCPFGNISITEGKPVWHGKCTHCMACICGCPTKAIEYKEKSKGQYRHYIMKNL